MAKVRGGHPHSNVWITHLRSAALAESRAMYPEEQAPKSSDFELMTELALKNSGIGYERLPVSFKLKDNGISFTFSPDFQLKFPMGFTATERVLLEPHGSQYFTHRFLTKLNTFMLSECHEGNYLVVLTDKAHRSEMQRTMASMHLVPADICDKLCIMNFDPSTPREACLTAISEELKAIMRPNTYFKSFWENLERR